MTSLKWRQYTCNHYFYKIWRQQSSYSRRWASWWWPTKCN